jgi:hypothetical protein
MKRRNNETRTINILSKKRKKLIVPSQYPQHIILFWIKYFNKQALLTFPKSINKIMMGKVNLELTMEESSWLNIQIKLSVEQRHNKINNKRKSTSFQTNKIFGVQK